MGQEEVYNLIRQSDKPLSRKDIAQALKLSPSTVSCSLNKLLKYNEIKSYKEKTFVAKNSVYKIDIYRQVNYYYIDKIIKIKKK